MCSFKLKDLESRLQDVSDFFEPKVELEQYMTTPHIASCMLHTVESKYGDISGKIVADLGCGTGMLLIGASLLGAGGCIGIDVDSSALQICRQNIEETGCFEADIIQMDIQNPGLGNINSLDGKFDTVVMNPPFGTRHKGADTDFLLFALRISKSAVYSLHKMSTIEHFARLGKSHNITVEMVAELNFNLNKTYSFQRSESRDISVALLRFSHPAPGQKALQTTFNCSETAVKKKQALKRGTKRR